MSRDDRILRYGAACAVIVIGVACGATISGTLGGTLATVLIGIGLLAVLILLFRELGLSDRSAPPDRRPPPPPAHSGDPRGTARPRARSDRPERLRGQRRRLK